MPSDRAARISHFGDRRIARTGGSLHDFVGINAPEVAALDPAGMIGGVDAAPVGAAFEQLCDDTGLRAGNRRGGRIGLTMQGADAALDDDGPLAGQHSLMHPALGALPIADHPPVLEFLDDLDRHLLAGQHPFNRVILARPDPQIHLVGTQADKARQLLPRLAFGRRRRMKPRGQMPPSAPRADTIMTDTVSVAWTSRPCCC